MLAAAPAQQAASTLVEEERVAMMIKVNAVTAKRKTNGKKSDSLQTETRTPTLAKTAPGSCRLAFHFVKYFEFSMFRI